MPAENLEEESLAKNPNLQLAQWKFMLTTETHKNDSQIAGNLMAEIKENNMTPFYEEVNK